VFLGNLGNPLALVYPVHPGSLVNPLNPGNPVLPESLESLVFLEDPVVQLHPVHLEILEHLGSLESLVDLVALEDLVHPEVLGI
jgi:hypothetical protein